MTTADDYVSISRFAEQFAGMMREPVPAEDARQLMRLLIDTVAIASYARRNQTGACASDMVGTPAEGPAEIWGTTRRTDPLTAAFLNGSAAEALDFQEVFIDGRNNGHAAVVIVPALVALDSLRENAGDDRLMRALRVAFAANALLARALGRGHRDGRPGFRTTSLTAPIAAALAGGLLLSEETEIAAHAAAICACSLPAGLLAAMSPDTGSFSVDKDLSVGFSARHALDCARLAANGATGPRSALSGPRSWLASYGFGSEDESLMLDDPAGIDLDRYALKIYPANYGCQCAIRNAIELAEGLAPEEVERVDVYVKTSSATSLSTSTINTHVSARFSLKYAVASAFCRGRSVLADFEAEAIADPRVLNFMSRIEVHADEDYQQRHVTEGVFPSRMSLATTDGRTLTAERTTPYDGQTAAERDAALASKIDGLCDAQTAARLTDILTAASDSSGSASIHQIFA
ncbi:MmgE/PrpD family protein [Pseudoroseicyclus sp. H15]